jgi:AAA15 family ATPase/GTPase
LKEGRLWSLEKGGKVLLKVEVIVGRGEMGKSTFAEAFGEIVTTLSIDVFLQAGRASTRFFIKE